ncbi:MAG: glycosyltransferase family 2 protein [Anaerolineales bacterium]|nr:glycosyltransferase family 2 protein [Anaerolineales bacterium]
MDKALESTEGTATATCPGVTVIVLNWNGAQTTLDCLTTVCAQDYPRYTVAVVDNGSTDGSPVIIGSAFPQVELITLTRNVGLSEGYNAGLRWALEQGCRYVLLLNNDVALAGDMLRVLVEEAERDPQAGLVSPKIFLGPPPSDRLYWTGGWFTLNPFRAPTRGYRCRDRGCWEDVCEADLSANTAVLARVEMVQAVGLLDPDYFYMCEDFDWSLRARQAGFRVLFVPHAHVWHLESATMGFLSPRMVYYYVRNMLLLSQRYLPHWRALRAMLYLQVPLFMVALLVIGRADGLRAPLWAVEDYRAGRFGQSERRF